MRADAAAALVAEARTWIGTPYRHGASARGAGCDCLGLLAGIARAVLGETAVPPIPPYAPDWAEAERRERLREACEAALLRRWDGEGAAPEPQAGDVLLFRWREGRPAAHLALATGAGTLIHAHARAAVAEVTLTPAWRRRLVAFFVFPPG